MGLSSQKGFIGICYLFNSLKLFHFRWDVAIKKARGRTTSEVTQSEFGEMVTIERTQQDLVT